MKRKYASSDATEQKSKKLAQGNLFCSPISYRPNEGAYENTDVKTPISSDAEESDCDSLFDAPGSMSSGSLVPEISEHKLITHGGIPNIPGLFFNPLILIPTPLAQDVWNNSMKMYFGDKEVNQVMLFQRTKSSLINGSAGAGKSL